jgi:hypothetical protein
MDVRALGRGRRLDPADLALEAERPHGLQGGSGEESPGEELHQVAPARLPAIYQVPGGTAVFAYHDRAELADRQLKKVAADFSLTLDELKDLL